VASRHGTCSACLPACLIALFLAVSLLVVPDHALAQQTVTPFGVGLADQIHAVTWSTVHPDTIYAGGDMCGVFRSTDRGRHWENWSDGLQNEYNAPSNYVDDILEVAPGDGIASSRVGVYAATHGGIYFRQGEQPWVDQTDPAVDEDAYSYKNGSAAPWQLPIPFSTLCRYDHGDVHYLLAGAGHARTGGTDDLYPCIDCGDNPGPTQHPDGTSPRASLWRLDLGDAAGCWVRVHDTDLGLVRQISTEGSMIALATSTGIYLAGSIGQVPEAIDGAEKTNFMGWSGLFWGVAFDGDQYLYMVTHRDTTGLSDYPDPGVYRYDILNREWAKVGNPSAVVAPISLTWKTLLEDSNTNLTTLRLRRLPGEGAVDLFVGNVTNPHHGGMLHARVQDGQVAETVEWEYALLGETPGTNPQHIGIGVASGVSLSWDPGWAVSIEATPHCELAISPFHPDWFVSWTSVKPQLSLDGGESWELISADPAGGGSWQGRGCEELSVNGLSYRSNGNLLVAARDYGVFEVATTGSHEFTWHDLEQRYASDVCAYFPRSRQVTRVLEVSPGVLLTIRGTKNCNGDPNQHHWADDHQTMLAYKQDGDQWRPVMSWDDRLAPVPGRKRNYTDLVQLPDGTVLASYHDGDDSGMVLLSWDGGTSSWTYQYYGPAVSGKKFIDLLLLPGDSRVLVAYLLDDGGVLCLDTDDPGAGYTPWLQGGTSDHLQRAAKMITCLVADASGTVVYAGSRGAPDGNDGVVGDTDAIGSVLRLEGPFPAGWVPGNGDWEMLANDGENTFGFSSMTMLRKEEWTAQVTAEHFTRITSLVVDPDDRRVVYAGLNAGEFHPLNGVWQYREGAWTQIAGGNGRQPRRSVTALILDRQAARTLVVGTSGENLFTVPLPDVPPEPAAAKFVDRSQEIYDNGNGLNYQGTPYAMLALDYDNDGDQDLLVSIQGSLPAQRFEHDGEVREGVPRMWRRSESSLHDDACRGLSCADYDNDGRLDVFVAHQTRPKLLHNIWTAGSNPETDPVFEDVAQQLGVASLATDSWCGAWGDYDRDGQVDLFVGRAGGAATDPLAPGADLTPAPNRLLRNRVLVDGAFQDRSDLLSNPHDAETRTVTASWVDIDADGDLDLFVGDVGEPGVTDNYSALYINKDDGSLADETDSRLLCELPAGQGGVAFSDYDLDGGPDMFVAGTEGVSLYLNYSDGRYDTKLLDLTSDPAMAVLPLDFDLDNITDYLVLPHGDGVTTKLYRVYETDTGISYVEDSAQLGLVVTGTTPGAAAADMTVDGDPDLLLARPAGDRYYFQNTNLYGGELPLKTWLGIRLLGDGGTNGAGIGALVQVTIDGRSFVKRVDGGGSLGGQSPLILHFGRDYVKSSYTTKVTWPDGYAQTVNLYPGSIVTVRDDSAPQYVAGSFHVGLTAKPGDLVDWSIEWDTQYGSDPSLDRFTVSDNPRSPSSCWQGTHTYTPGMPQVSATITPLPGGGYHHVMVWSDRPCGTGCSYRITASSGTWNEDGTIRRSDTEQQTVSLSVCLPNIQK